MENDDWNFGRSQGEDEGNGEDKESSADSIPTLDDIGGPLPRRPWALVTEGTVEEGELVLHRDYETERNHVMLFETLDDAYSLATQFKEATGREATPKPCDPQLLEEQFYIRLFRPGGIVLDISREAYRDLTDLE